MRRAALLLMSTLLIAMNSNAAPPTRTRDLGEAPGGYRLRARYSPTLCQNYEQLTADGEPFEREEWTLEISKAGKVTAKFVIGGAIALCDEWSGKLAQPLVDDFDFDGRLDFAISVDHSGPYGTITRDLFLAARGTRPFVAAPALSTLWYVSTGVEIDAKRKRLISYSKSGCCIHYRSEYAVARRQPVLLWSEVVTISFDEPGRCFVTTDLARSGKPLQTQRRACRAEER